jgi:drug/metabolite transporter (DMT)-like permease
MKSLAHRPPEPRGFTPYALLTLAALCWAGNIVVARGVIEFIPPIGFAFWRWMLASLIVLPFGAGHIARHWKEIVQGWRMLLLLALLGISCFNTLLYTAVHTTTAVNGALIQTTMPAVIILVSRIIYREKSAVMQLLGVVLCAAGAATIVMRGSMTLVVQLDFATGDFLVIAAVVLYALYSVLLRDRPAIHPLAFLSVTFSLGAMGLLPFYLGELLLKGPLEVDLRVAGSIGFVAVFPSIVAYFCWNRGVQLIGANRAGLFINLVPVFASALAIVFLGESVRWYHFTGLALIFGGAILFHFHSKA